MAAHFYPLTIRSVKKETTDCVSIVFEVPETLKETFAFKQGQHLTIRHMLNGAEVRRNYSLCTTPASNEWRIAVKKIETGLFSSYANEMVKPGDRLEVMPPMGNFFTPLHPANSKNYVAIAAGSGITPIISIIRTTLLTEPGSRFTLVFANKNRDSIIFKEELEALKNSYMHRFSVHHIFSREKTGTPIYEGRIDKEKCDLIFSKLVNLSSVSDCFICGPASLIEMVRTFLESNGMDKQQIHYELFNVEDSKKVIQARQQPRIKMEEGASATIVIKIDGLQSTFMLDYNGDSILEAALKQGADLPYACKGGVCCTCKAKLLEGEVQMDINYGLEETEIAAGYILTCQSHPITKKVTIDFDNR